MPITPEELQNIEQSLIKFDELSKAVLALNTRELPVDLINKLLDLQKEIEKLQTVCSHALEYEKDNIRHKRALLRAVDFIKYHTDRRGMLTSCICQPAFKPGSPDYIKPQFYDQLENFALNLQKNTITIVSIGCGLLEDEFNISQRLMLRGLNINWILIDPMITEDECLLGRDSISPNTISAFLELTGSHPPHTCKIVGQFSDLGYYAYAYSKKIFKNNQEKASYLYGFKPTLNIRRADHEKEKKPQSVDPDIIMCIDIPEMDTAFWLGQLSKLDENNSAEAKFFMLENQGYIKLPGQDKMSFKKARRLLPASFVASNETTTSITENKESIPAPTAEIPVLHNNNSKSAEDETTTSIIEKKESIPAPAAEMPVLHNNNSKSAEDVYTKIESALKHDFLKHKFFENNPTKLVLAQHFIEEVLPKLKNELKDSVSLDAETSTKLKTLLLTVARKHFKNDHQVLRLLADVLLTVLFPVGILVGSLRVSQKLPWFFSSQQPTLPEQYLAAGSYLA